MEKRTEVFEALADWILRVVEKEGLATPKEIEALPEVAKVFFESYSPLDSFSVVKKE